MSEEGLCPGLDYPSVMDPCPDYDHHHNSKEWIHEGRKDACDQIRCKADLGTLEPSTPKSVTRAVVAVLPTADVSDSLRVEIREDRGTVAQAKVWRSGVLVFDGVSRSALLDAQAAAHSVDRDRAVTTEYHNRMMNQAGAACEVLRAERDTASAEVEALRAEVERLHTWDGLLELLDEHWPADIFPTLPDDPERDNGPRIVSLIRWVEALREKSDRAYRAGKDAGMRAGAGAVADAEADRDAYRARIDKVRALVAEHDAALEAYDSAWDPRLPPRLSIERLRAALDGDA